MNILPDSATNFKYISPLRAARSEAFLEYLKEEVCAVFLDNKLYEHWYDKGWNKEDIENAINDLAIQKIISVSAFQDGRIIMGIYEPGDLARIYGGNS